MNVQFVNKCTSFSVLCNHPYCSVVCSFYLFICCLQYARDPCHLAFYSMQTLEWLACRFRWRTVYNNGKNVVIYQTAGQ